MGARGPLWRRAFDKAERAVGGPLEEAVKTEQFADAVMLANRLQTGLRRRLEQGSRRMLHLVNLPAASDVQRLHEQIWALERQIRDLSKKLDDDARGG